jgi:hypothetical protein
MNVEIVVSHPDELGEGRPTKEKPDLARLHGSVA